MRLSEQQRQILDYLRENESITARQAADLVYGDNITRVQVDAARRSLMTMVSNGLIRKEGREYVSADRPELMAIRDRIMWIFSDEGQAWLMGNVPAIAAAAIPLERIHYVFYCLADRDDDLNLPYEQLYHAIQTMIEDGLLVTEDGRTEIRCIGDRSYHRKQRIVKYAPPWFKPTPEQIAAAADADDKRWNRAIDTMIKAFHPGLFR